MKKNKEKVSNPQKKKLKRIFIILCVVCALLLLVFSVVFASNHILNKMNRDDGEIETIAPEDESFDSDTDDEDTLDYTTLELASVDPLADDGLLNVLLVGQDRRPGESRTRSDAMILISCNLDTKEVSVISFLRDLYVKIPGYSSNRMNAAYCWGGYDLLSATFLENFGVHLDGYFEVDFDNFIKVIDSVGGVDIDLTSAEANRIGAAGSGTQHLNGELALKYARIRKLDSDFGRTNRQRKVLLSLFNQVKTLNITEITSLINTVLPMITTNISNKELINYAVKLLPYATSMDINTYHVPADGTYTDEIIRGMMVLVPDLTKINDLLKNEYLPF